MLIYWSFKCEVCSEFGWLKGKTKTLGNSACVIWINLEEVLKASLLNVSSYWFHWTNNIVCEMLSASLTQYLSVKSSWLLVVSIGVRMLISASCASQSVWSPSGGWIFDGTSEGVWLIVRTISLVSIHGCRAISLIVGNSSSVWTIDWNLVEVRSESMSVGIWVREDSSLEHLIHWWFNTWNQVSRSESNLFCLREIVLWVSVKNHFTYWNQRVISLWPYLGHIENIKFIGLSILFWHNLHFQGPSSGTSILNMVIKIFSGVILVSCL